jgi:Cys-tRNA(Pro)/Cys-tRNA(Cys) deacylase
LKNAKFVNNVTRLLDAKKVPYEVYTYDYDAGIHSAVEVAQAIGRSPEQVYKTLVVESNEARRKPMLVMIPGPATLDLKKLAAEVGAKKLHMARRAQAEAMTGLLAGGISPLALLNRGFEIYLDNRARDLERIVVSAGQRGAQVSLPVTDLVKLTRARFVELT